MPSSTAWKRNPDARGGGVTEPLTRVRRESRGIIRIVSVASPPSSVLHPFPLTTGLPWPTIPRTTGAHPPCTAGRYVPLWLRPFVPSPAGILKMNMRKKTSQNLSALRTLRFQPKNAHPVRKVSKLSNKNLATLATLILPGMLRTVRDPMSGYFLVRRSVIDSVSLRPKGYKILLEVLARGNYSTVVEIPYVFRERKEGGSKLGPIQYVEFVLHIGALASEIGRVGRFIRFCAVGLSGVVVNQATLAFSGGRHRPLLSLRVGVGH